MYLLEPASWAQGKSKILFPDFFNIQEKVLAAGISEGLEN